METTQTPKPAILHVCHREMLRPPPRSDSPPSGYGVDSTLSATEARAIVDRRPYGLVLIDVDGEDGIHAAEALCADIRTAHPGQLVAFVCNWRVAALTDCPDEILRAEFDPAAFVAGVRAIVPNSHS